MSCSCSWADRRRTRNEAGGTLTRMDNLIALEIFFLCLVGLASLGMAFVSAVVIGGLFKGQR